MIYRWVTFASVYKYLAHTTHGQELDMFTRRFPIYVCKMSSMNEGRKAFLILLIWRSLSPIPCTPAILFYPWLPPEDSASFSPALLCIPAHFEWLANYSSFPLLSTSSMSPQAPLHKLPRFSFFGPYFHPSPSLALATSKGDPPTPNPCRWLTTTCMKSVPTLGTSALTCM